MQGVQQRRCRFAGRRTCTHSPGSSAVTTAVVGCMSTGTVDGREHTVIAGGKGASASNAQHSWTSTNPKSSITLLLSGFQTTTVNCFLILNCVHSWPSTMSMGSADA